MVRKTFIILSVLLITIVLLAGFQYFITEDKISTQKERLSFFSNNLQLQKKLIFSTLKNNSTIISDDILNSHIWQNNPTANEETQLELLRKMLGSTMTLKFKQLEKLGFTSLSIIVRTNNNKTLSLRIDPNDSLQPIDNKNSFQNELEGNTISYYKQKPEYQFINSQYIDTNQLAVQISIGIDFLALRSKLTENIPESTVGYLMFTGDSTFNPSHPSFQSFEHIHKDYPFYFNKTFIPIIDKKLTDKALKQLNANLKTISKAGQSFSIYLNTRKEPKVLSISPIETGNNTRKLHFACLVDDYILDKTNDWNNQIFLTNLIILTLIMFGITYLFINRAALLKQKQAIEESEMKLKKINNSKDKFFSIIAHDLKNPFNGIMGMTGYLSESYDNISDQERKDIINDLNISSKNAFNLLQNLLEWTRTQSGTLKNVPTDIDPASIIEISLETVGNLAKNKNIEIIQRVDTKRHGYADENLIATVLRNLFTNAVKFSPRKSQIEVTVKEFEKELVFCVKDSGIGLHHNEIDQLFRIDVNFHKKGTEEETGTGLGLKICKEFVEYCNGRIWVISEPNKGSSFYFTIPLYTK